MKNRKSAAMILAEADNYELSRLSGAHALLAPIGGKYRLIDFALSRCGEAGFNDVALVTSSLSLYEYVMGGRDWGLERTVGGLKLPILGCESSGEGTTGAKESLRRYLLGLEAENIVLLSGDCVFNLGVSEMLEAHFEAGADFTLAVKSGDGSVVTDGEFITDFLELPGETTIGACVISKRLLLKAIDRIGERITSEAVLQSVSELVREELGELTAVAYEQSGYFAAVTSAASLLSTDMDILGSRPDVRDELKTLSRLCRLPPSYVDGEVSNSLLGDGCEIYGSVNSSVIGNNVTVAGGAVIRRSVIMNGAIIGENAVVDNAVIGENVTVGDGAIVGENGGEPAVIAGCAEIGVGERIVAGSFIDGSD